MKKIIFFFVLVIMLMVSCTKESSFINVVAKPKDSSAIHVDYKPMPKKIIPDEQGNN